MNAKQAAMVLVGLTAAVPAHACGAPLPDDHTMQVLTLAVLLAPVYVGLGGLALAAVIYSMVTREF